MNLHDIKKDLDTWIEWASNTHYAELNLDDVMNIQKLVSRLERNEKINESFHSICDYWKDKYFEEKKDNSQVKWINEALWTEISTRKHQDMTEKEKGMLEGLQVAYKIYQNSLKEESK